MINVTLGQYYPGKSVIHRLDPRTKLILTLAYIVLVFLVQSVWGYVAVAAYVFMGLGLARISPKYLIRGLKPIIFIVVLTFVLNMFTYGGGFRFTMAGLYAAIRLSLRLIFLVMGSQVLTLTTAPLDLTDGIEHLLRPLSAIHFPVHEIAMMMSIALRFIPTLLEEADRIMKAQMSRGADFESGNIFRRARNMVPLLVPLFVSAFRRADDLAVAMEARCYRGGTGRTRMKQLHYSKLDLYAGLTLVALVAVVVLDRTLLVRLWP